MNSELTEVVWWESCLTEHQIHTLHELSCLPNVKLSAYVLKFENTDRKRQGWKECDLSLINTKLISTFLPFVFIGKILKNKRNCVHIFAGPFDSLWITLGLFFSLFINNRTYVLTEPYSPIGAELLDNGNILKSWLLKKMRPMKYKILWGLIRRKIEGVFAISPLAIKQLVSFKVDYNKILPYAYFVPSVESYSASDVNKHAKNSDENLKFIFVGSLNYRKGLDIAIEALDYINNPKIILDIFGPGNVKNAFSKSSNVNYKGTIPFGLSQSKISEYDLLILPSRFDGWGVVVNEALLAGVPVICSNQVGASALIKKWNCGLTFDCSNIEGLIRQIESIFADKDKIIGRFHENILHVRESISPKCGAEYITSSIQCLENGITPQKDKWYDSVVL